MKRLLATTLVAGLALVACGSDDDGGGSDAKDQLYDELTADGAGAVFDEGCLRDLVDDLSDEDAQLLVDNIDATEDELAESGPSEAALEFIGSLLGCADLSDIDLGELGETGE